MPTALRRPRFRPQKERRRALGCDPGGGLGLRRPPSGRDVGRRCLGARRRPAFGFPADEPGARDRPARPSPARTPAAAGVRGRGVRGGGRARRGACAAAALGLRLGPQRWTAVSRRGPGQGGGGFRTVEHRAQGKAAGWPDPGPESHRAPRTPHGSRSPARGRPARSRSRTGQCCGSGPQWGRDPQPFPTPGRQHLWV